MGNIIRCGNSNIKSVSFTFDDGPHPVWTNSILDVLEKFRLSATFFVVGCNAEKYSDVIKRMEYANCEIGNHTFSHIMLPFYSHKKIVSEIKKTEEIIISITGKKPRYFRPPRGIITPFATDFLIKNGYKIVLWTFSSRDWLLNNPQKIEKRVLKLVKPGSIILFHDAGGYFSNKGGKRDATVKALPYIIEELKNNGYEIVSLEKIW